MTKKRRAVIISGGMGDIGKAIALKLAKDGFKIFLLYYSSSTNEVNDFLNSLSGNEHLACKCDLTIEEEVKKAVGDAENKMKGIDVCVHAAVSPIVRKRAGIIEIEDFKNQFEVTTFGGLRLFQKIIPVMRRQKEGKIIAITSGALEESNTPSGMAGYVSAKEALQSVLRELSKELLNDNIKVNAVAPGFVPTSLHNDLPKQVLSFIKERAKTVTKEEVASVVSLLCSDKLSSVTGMSYPVKEGVVRPL
jgi:3-oxoacyl-[acyl-carrier protein] reductase